MSHDGQGAYLGAHPVPDIRERWCRGYVFFRDAVYRDAKRVEVVLKDVMRLPVGDLSVTDCGEADSTGRSSEVVGSLKVNRHKIK